MAKFKDSILDTFKSNKMKKQLTILISQKNLIELLKDIVALEELL